MSKNNPRSASVLAFPTREPARVIGVPCIKHYLNGRETLLEQKVEYLVRGKDVNFSIVGGPGIGKTSFALAITQHPKIIKRFRDGIFWMNVGRYAEPAYLIAWWARFFDVDLIRNATLEHRIRAIRQEVCQREILVILDDVFDLEIAYHLVCDVSRCVLIVVSENPEVGKTFSGKRRCVYLPGLDNPSSIQLINSILRNGVSVFSENLGDLVNACQGNPLVMKRAAGYLNLTLSTGINRVSDIQLAEHTNSLSGFIERLSASTGDNEKLNFITTSILDQLPSQTVAGFYHLAAFNPDPLQFDKEAALVVSELREEELQTLIDLQLISAEGDKLWFTKDINDFILKHIPDQAIERHRYYLQSRTKEFNRDQDDMQSDYEQIWWSFRNFPNNDSFPDLVGILAENLLQNGLWQDFLEIGEKSLQIAKMSSQLDGLFKLYNNIANVNSILNQKEKALDYYNLALNLIDPKENCIEYASTLNNIGTIYANLSQFDHALLYLEKAQQLINGVDDPIIEANIYNNLGSVDFALGNQDRALESLMCAFNLIPFLNDNELITRIYFNLALVFYEKGDLSESITKLRYAVELENNRADPDYELDLALLSEMEKEFTKPRYFRWIRRKFQQLIH
jgi:tetratricopeptide (TPR) repeat protein